MSVFCGKLFTREFLTLAYASYSAEYHTLLSVEHCSSSGQHPIQQMHVMPFTLGPSMR